MAGSFPAGWMIAECGKGRPRHHHVVGPFDAATWRCVPQYERTTLSRSHERAGFGRGSLYHFFPGGKEEMVTSVLAEIDAWFEQHVFEPLRQEDGAEHAFGRMFDAVARYFGSGDRVCLVGTFALTDTRDRFDAAVAGYFTR
jgi:AcrR family transcriptional regulator